jgi:uncharacterized phage protein (TIGR01671 family)
MVYCDNKHYWAFFNSPDSIGYGLYHRNDGHRVLSGEYNPPIMQFTGLTDKNGKEIYEGDVVKVTNKGGQNGVKVVAWDETTLSYCLIWLAFYSPDWDSGNSDTTYLKVTKGISCVVVGNVYEHPHLLAKNNQTP